MDCSPSDKRGSHGMPWRDSHTPTHNASATGSPQDGLPRTSGSTSLPDQGAGPDVAKRTARGKACERCRKMKIKCDGRTPKCGTCRKRALQCVFTFVEKPQKPQRREEYVRGLENRLSRLESIVETSGILDDSPSDPSAGNSSYVDFDFDIHSLLVDDEASGLNMPRGTPEQYSGHSREASPRIAKPTSPGDLWGLASRSSRRPEWISDIIEDVVSRGLGPPTAASPQSLWPSRRALDERRQLPPMDEVLSLAADFFASCNKLFPLYHEETFMAQLYENMAMSAAASSAWWAGLYTILATAHIVRLRGTFFPQEQERKAFLYIKNAIAIQTESPVLDFDILSVQALIGMALFFRITSFSSQMPSMLIATAIRISHGIGLHVNCQDPNISDIEREQRKRVFWIAYIFDCELSLRTGRAPLQADADMSLDLPQDNPPDKAGYVGGANIFHVKCILAQIQAKVYKQLYSDQAWNQPRHEILAAVSALDHDLEEWRLSIPEDLRPGTKMPDLPPPYSSQIFILHFCYWYSFSLIHRRYAICIGFIGNWPPSAVPDSISPSRPGAATLNAYRNMVELLKDHPPGAKGLRWYVLYYTAAALVCLFMHILHDPQNESAEQDLARIQVVLRFMGVTCGDDDNRDASSLFGICTKLEGIAVKVLERRGSGSGGGGGEEEQREREQLGRQVQRQLHFHGRFFTPLDV